MLRFSETTSLLGNEEIRRIAQDEEQRNLEDDIVGWEGDDDLANPLNWSERKKWYHVAIVSLLTFLIPLGATMFAPGVKQAMQDLNSFDDVIASLSVSIYVLGWAIGPLILAPLSEVRGRWIIYSTCNILFVIFTVACALSTDLVMLIVWRFLAGAVGSTPLSIGGGTISDLIALQNRGLALSLYMLGPVLGPSIGPVMGGLLTNTLGWRWIFWVLAIVYGVMTVVQIIFMKETYAGAILKMRTKHLQEVTGNKHLRSKLDPGLSSWQILLGAIIRPLKITLKSPINILLSLASAYMNGLLFLLLTAFSLIFEQIYGFLPTELGLSFLGIGAGNLIGLAIFTLTSDRYIRSRVSQGALKPEDRLIHVLVSGPIAAVGLLWFGWSVHAHTHWIVPIVGSALIGAANILFFTSIIAYLVDAFTVYAASAIAANMVVRSIGGTLLPLAGTRMYQVLGLGWGNSLLAFLALCFTPALIFLFINGEAIRRKYPIKL